MKLIFLAMLCASLAVAAERPRSLVLLTNCAWVAAANNDGDSFHVRIGTSNVVVRLFDVDAAEVKPTTAARHALQTNYFKADGARLREIGREASAFTSNQLARPFSILTRWTRSYGGDRVLVYALTADGADLGRLLVSNRLARAHGGTYNPPPPAR